MNNPDKKICIIGGGLVGLTAAYAFAMRQIPVTLIAPKQKNKDNRTTALLSNTVEIFKDLGLWEKLSGKAFPLKTMRIVDGTNRLIRARQVDFQASEIGLDAFGQNLRNQDLLDLLKSELDKLPNLEMLDTTVRSISKCNEIYELELSDNQIRKCEILIGADGRNSLVAGLMDGEPKRWEYPQHALVVDFEHTVSNQYVSTEFHKENGPFTIVPHSLNKSGLVWMEKPGEVARLKALSKEELSQEIEKTMQSFLGKVTTVTSAQTFPISGMVAQRFGKDSHVLLGEAAHVFPPIGAQGFNLGMRDLKSLIEIFEAPSETGEIGNQYHAARTADINTRTYGTDLLNRSLLSPFLPVQMIRSIGLFALDKITPLRKLIMNYGIAPKKL